MNIVDDPYMVRIEALQQLDDMGAAFRELTQAWMPKGEAPSLRDLFAGMALQGWRANPNGKYSTYEDAAKEAYLYADAMLKTRQS